ncbi:MAG: cytochrome c [Gemmatimonadota bacterium]|jgi:mono/diheme cytochrome c family protein
MRTVRTIRRLLLLALVLPAACERVEVDPSVAQRPLPSPGDPVDATLAEAGAVVFQKRCVACHRLEGPDLVGPTLGDVADRRDYEWIRGIVLAPDSMLRTDEDARALLDRYLVPMVDTGLDEPRFRAVLEFLRKTAARGTPRPDAGGGER